MPTPILTVPYQIVAEWTQITPAGLKEYHFVLRTKRLEATYIISELTESFGAPELAGSKWYWDSENDHGTLNESTLTVVFIGYEDAVLFKLSQGHYGQ